MGLITLQNKVSTFAATKRNNMSTILFADHTAKRTLTAQWKNTGEFF